MLGISTSCQKVVHAWKLVRYYATKPGGPKSSGKHKKPSQVKEVILSWLISKNDLESQKRKAIESILKKGDKLQIRLENRNKKFHKPSENELEARNNLLERVHQLVEQSGGSKAKPPQGSVVTRMMLFYQSANSGTSEQKK